MQDVEIVVPGRVLEALQSLGWDIQGDETHRTLTLCSSAEPVSLRIDQGKASLIRDTWQLTADHLDRSGWEVVIGHLIAAAEFHLEQVVVTYADSWETKIPADSSRRYALTIDGDHWRLESVQVEAVNADLTPGEESVYLEARVALEDREPARCRVCDIPLSPAVEDDSDDTCAGCRRAPSVGHK
jgi:hypothetical protein